MKLRTALSLGVLLSFLMGSVLPAFPVGFGPPGVFKWQRGMGGSSGDGVSGVAVDPSGNWLVVGNFSTTADFGAGTLTSAGVQDVWIGKYSSTGTPIWTKRIGGSGADNGRTVAVDTAGNVLVVGRVQSTIDLGGGPQAGFGADDIFIVKYDAGGAYQWSKHLGSSGGDAAAGVAVDTDGNVIVVGSFQGTVDFGGQSLAASSSVDAFLVKYSPSGALVWAQRFASTTGLSYYAVATDLSGNIVVTGTFAGTTNLGSGSLTSVGLYDLLVAKYSPTGTGIWSVRGGGPTYDAGNAIAVDSGGNAVVTGYFQGAADFGGGPLSGTANVNNVVIAKYGAADGAHQWSHGYGGPNGATGTAITVGGADNSTITGYFGGTASFGGATFSSFGGSDDIVVAKYTPTGAHFWSKMFGDADTDRGAAVATNATAILVGGFFTNQIYFTTEPPPHLVSHGIADAFLLNLGP